MLDDELDPCAELGEGAVRSSGEFVLATSDRAAPVQRVPVRDEERMGNAGR